MDRDVLKLQAHVDQTRSEVRNAWHELPRDRQVELIRICAAGRIHTLDDKERLLIGMLAIVSIFELAEGKD